MQFEKHHVALVTNIFISYLNPYMRFSPRLCAHTLPQLALLFPTSCCSAEGGGLVAKYTEGPCRRIWPRNMKNLLWWNSTFQCRIRGYTPLCYTCVWQSPFVVAGGTTRGYLERENVPKHSATWLLPVTSGFQIGMVPVSMRWTQGWDQTYTTSKKAAPCESAYICTWLWMKQEI